MGETSGVPVLVEMVNSPAPLMDNGIDFRLLAPSTLVSFDQVLAADAVAALYLRLRAERNAASPQVRACAAKLGSRQIIPFIIEDTQQELWPNNFEDLGTLRSTEGTDLMRAELADPKAPPYRRAAVKVAAAWALARSGETEPHTQWLMEHARSWVDNLKNVGRDVRETNWRAFDFLTTLKTAGLREFFERALESPNPEALEPALIYLCLNYSDSRPCREKLLDLLHSNLPGIDWTTLECFAWQSGDAEIEAAMERNADLVAVDPFYSWATQSASYRNFYLGNHLWKK